MIIPFRKVELSSREAIDALLKDNDTPICDYCFANIFAWQPVYYTEWANVCGVLVVRFRLDDGGWGYMPVGKGDISVVVEALKQDAAERNIRFRLVSFDSRYAGLFGPDYAVCDNPDYRDYIYSVEELCELRGRKFQPKRNHINRFESNYNYTFNLLGPSDFDDCVALESLWQARKCATMGVTCSGEGGEQCAIRRIFANYESLDMLGGVLRVEGRIAAFVVGSRLTSDTFCVHFEKADIDYEGVFPMINRLFALELAKKGYSYVNREEDMGLDGLRRAKQSYHPVRLEPKLGIALLAEREKQCRMLWHDVFGDDVEFIDSFLVEYYRPENMLVIERDGGVISMLYIVEMQTDYGHTGYLYAIATCPEWRRKGFASELINRALEISRERGFAAVMLIPSGDDVKRFYQSFGFEDVGYKLDFSEGFDFGTGDSALDLAMVKVLK